ncbi:MAG: HsdR family type I site-specific deoxyribonuclease, partial [Actinomycetota bacterium]|nr:HsdR family type I site-specific deoxyribonuclease [Actinomycetota bacterium]
MIAAIARFSESVVEAAALEWFAALGYTVLHGPDIAPGEPAAERQSFAGVVLRGRLEAAIVRLNPGVPASARDDAVRRLLRRESPSLIVDNRAFHRMLVDGVGVEYLRPDGGIAGDRVRLVDFENPDNNDFVVLNQLTVSEAGKNRRPDLVVYVNGLPLAVFELKDAATAQATIWGAFNQLQTYKQEIPSLFVFNEVLAVSDGTSARAGSLTADRERFMAWRTIEGEDLASGTLPQLQVLIQGMFEQRRLLDIIRHFIVFEEDGAAVQKKLAGYHQFHAVNHAVETTVKAAGVNGTRRAGVVWHTQGSGKSLTMLFYAGRVILRPELSNPTLVVVTDRNDLDEQLFGTFARCHDLLRQSPRQASGRDDLQDLLRVASGGVVFTTMQKFIAEQGTRMPLQSARQNIIVVVDEAHRSQYDFIDGFARNLRDALPNATFI